MSKAPKTAAAVKPEHYDLIKKPVITEKATMASEAGAVVFQVAMAATNAMLNRPSALPRLWLAEEVPLKNTTTVRVDR